MPPARLLILDDDPTVGRLLVYVAQAAGFEARLCERAHDFFEAVRDWAPTLLAIDLQMPDMDGLDVMRALAADGCTARVIISSGAGRAEVDAALLQAQGLGLHMAGVLAKPFSLASLRALLAQPHDGPG